MDPREARRLALDHAVRVSADWQMERVVECAEAFYKFLMSEPAGQIGRAAFNAEIAAVASRLPPAVDADGNNHYSAFVQLK